MTIFHQWICLSIKFSFISITKKIHHQRWCFNFCNFLKIYIILDNINVLNKFWIYYIWIGVNANSYFTNIQKFTERVRKFFEITENYRLRLKKIKTNTTMNVSKTFRKSLDVYRKTYNKEISMIFLLRNNYTFRCK